MEEFTRQWDYVFITDEYSWKERLLQSSLKDAGFAGAAIVLTDDFFLQADAYCVQELVCGRTDPASRISPRYYNEVALPDGWTVSSGREDGSDTGRICFQHQIKGRIHYANSTGRYFVADVDWFDHHGTVRVIDHYDRCGDICGRTTCDGEGKPILCSWYDAAGRDILSRNLVTGDYLYHDGDSEQIFPTKEELLGVFLKKRCKKDVKFFIGSMGKPFEICSSIGEGSITLFAHSAQLGKQKDRLLQNAEKLDRIFAQDRNAFRELAALPIDQSKVKRLGYIYPFAKDNEYAAEALILTNSDNLEHLADLTAMLPNVNFHIAAITNMSEKLVSMGDRENVFLYPGAKESVMDSLYQKCDIYLDINHFSELQNAVFKAFLHNQLIFAFRNTMHNTDYVPETQIFSSADWENMARSIRILLEDPFGMEKALRNQRAFALTQKVRDYCDALA